MNTPISSALLCAVLAWVCRFWLLTKSAVDKERVRRIDAGMTETSQWVHDQPRGGHSTVPSPDELKDALGHLDDVLTLIAKGAAAAQNEAA
jgi:hypothetical protein